MTTSDISIIVRAVLREDITLETIRGGVTASKKEVKYIPVEVIDNKKSEFTSISTDLVTNEFFKSAETSIELIKLIYDSFTEAINTYAKYKKIGDNKIFFIYKGGNILRFLNKNFIDRVPDEGIKKKLIDLFDDAFGKSDADFNIYIDPTLENYDEVYTHMTVLSYLVLNFLRNEFMTKKDKYFYIYQTNEKKILEKYMTEKYQLASSLFDNKNDEMFGKKLFALRLGKSVIFDGSLDKAEYNETRKQIELLTQQNNEKDVVNYKEGSYNVVKKISHVINREKTQSDIPLPDEISELIEKYGNTSKTSEYLISVNTTLAFNKKKQKIKFNLVRMKVNIELWTFKDSSKSGKFETFPGEIIDIGISHRDSYDVSSFFANYKNNMIKYSFGTKETDVIFNGYTLEYLQKEIYEILYKEINVPWENVKYVKRLKRLLFLCYVDLIIHEGNLTEKIQYLTRHKDALVKILEVVKKNETYSEKNMLEVKEAIKSQRGSDGQQGISTYDKIIDSSLEIMMHVYVYDNKSEYVQYLEKLGNIINSLIDVTQDIVNLSGKINIGEIITKNTIYSTMKGGYHNSYIKYKNKYLTLKNFIEVGHKSIFNKY